jgi:hypothetical protein
MMTATKRKSSSSQKQTHLHEVKVFFAAKNVPRSGEIFRQNGHLNARFYKAYLEFWRDIT